MVIFDARNLEICEGKSSCIHAAASVLSTELHGRWAYRVRAVWPYLVVGRGTRAGVGQQLSGRLGTEVDQVF